MRVYTDEFRSDAVAMCHRGNRSLIEVATDLGVNHWTLRDWYRKDQLMKKRGKQATKVTPPPEPETPQETIKRLERDVARLEREKAQLQMDREILKKAAAFFAKENE